MTSRWQTIRPTTASLFVNIFLFLKAVYCSPLETLQFDDLKESKEKSLAEQREIFRKKRFPIRFRLRKSPYILNFGILLHIPIS